jgi:hypothetical protein
MKIEYKPNDVALTNWVFELPDGVGISDNGFIEELGFSTVVDAMGLVNRSLLMISKRAIKSTAARHALNVVSSKLKFNRPFGEPMPLDKAHLQHWGFYWSEEKLAEVSEAVQEVLEADSPEAVLAGLREEMETRTNEKGEAQKKAAEDSAAGRLQDAKLWEDRAQKHAHRLEVLSTQLRLLTPSGRLALQTPAQEPSESSDALAVSISGGLDARLADAEARDANVKARVEERGQSSLIRWIYGKADTLICHVKPKMPLQQRLLYILSKNSDPSPVQFATLFMEINSSERCVEPGRNALTACKAAHAKHDARFCFDALPEREREEYRRICFSKSSCAVCGRGVVGDKVHCSDACAAKACECCGGPMEHTELSREVPDMDRAREIYRIKGVLGAKGVVQPVSYLEKQQKLHQECRGFVACFAACGECQDTHNAWLQQHADWKQFGRMPASFWEQNQAHLAALEEMAENKTIVEVKRKCAAGCPDEQRAEKRRRVY